MCGGKVISRRKPLSPGVKYVLRQKNIRSAAKIMLMAKYIYRVIEFPRTRNILLLVRHCLWRSVHCRVSRPCTHSWLRMWAEFMYSICTHLACACFIWYVILCVFLTKTTLGLNLGIFIWKILPPNTSRCFFYVEIPYKRYFGRQN